MSQTLTANIVERTISGETDKRLQIAGGHYVRKLKEGSDWTKLRIGIRLSTNRNSTWSSPPKFYFGLCSGTTNPPGSLSAGHFLGISNQGSGLLSWSNSTDYVIFSQRWCQPIIIENGSQRNACDGGQVGSNYYIHKSDKGKIAWMLEVTKGASWTMEGRGPTSLSISDQPDVSYFNDGMAAPSPMATDTKSWYNNTLVSDIAAPFAVDETTYGVLDTVCFSWLGENVYDTEDNLIENNAFEISDIAVKRLA